ncbi:rubredoxin-like domain-containing protein [Chrysiogenes arsenatis]|uniref:rubredoxin-like domain-containing protein n=1 Tax=Chrysiogenes arsenatis TaxID=309797 RepID=UPI0004075846|nr:hypothetical protein [Chrysiogenes arsenatis]
MQKYRCSKCRLLHFGDTPPLVCPLCTAPESAFTEDTEASRSLDEYAALQVRGDSWEATHLGHYALQCETLGIPHLSPPLLAMAQDELRHATGFARWSGAAATRDELLDSFKTLLEGKKGSRKLKLEGASLAYAEGNVPLAAWFRVCAEDEERHIRTLEWALRQFQKFA